MITKTCNKCGVSWTDNNFIWCNEKGNWWDILHCTHDWQEPVTATNVKIRNITLAEQLNNKEHPMQQEQSPIRFIPDSELPKGELTFEMVEENQFFVDDDGNLCQKANANQYQKIALENGTPFADHHGCNVRASIKRILPRITKIEF